MGNGLGPPIIWIPALVVAVAMLLPPLYLFLSVTKTGKDILDIFKDPDTFEACAYSESRHGVNYICSP